MKGKVIATNFAKAINIIQNLHYRVWNLRCSLLFDLMLVLCLLLNMLHFMILSNSFHRMEHKIVLKTKQCTCVQLFIWRCPIRLNVWLCCSSYVHRMNGNKMKSQNCLMKKLSFVLKTAICYYHFILDYCLFEILSTANVMLIKFSHECLFLTNPLWSNVWNDQLIGLEYLFLFMSNIEQRWKRFIMKKWLVR